MNAVTVESRVGREVAATIDHGDGSAHQVWFRSADRELALTGAALVCAALLPSMARGSVLSVPLPLDDRFRAGIDRAQRVLARWYPELTPVPIEAPGGLPVSPVGRTAAFFTGGVDSFHVALTRATDIDDLVFVHGFDVPLTGAPALRDAVVARLHDIAPRLGHPLVEVETNLHAYSDAVGSPWGTHYHGAALATVAHTLSGGLSRVLVGATHDYTDQFPWGTHPLLDPLWSSEVMEVEHAGAEADRVDKLEVLAGSDVAMANLRVCWLNPDQAYNCGRCPKCVRTMVALVAVGALDRCATLPHDLDLDRVRELPIPNRNILARQAELIAHLRANGGPDDLLAACEQNLAVIGVAGIDWGATGWTTAIPGLVAGEGATWSS